MLSKRAYIVQPVQNVLINCQSLSQTLQELSQENPLLVGLPKPLCRFREITYCRLHDLQKQLPYGKIEQELGRIISFLASALHRDWIRSKVCPSSLSAQENTSWVEQCLLSRLNVYHTDSDRQSQRLRM